MNHQIYRAGLNQPLRGRVSYNPAGSYDIGRYCANAHLPIVESHRIAYGMVALDPKTAQFAYQRELPCVTAMPNSSGDLPFEPVKPIKDRTVDKNLMKGLSVPGQSSLRGGPRKPLWR